MQLQALQCQGEVTTALNPAGPYVNPSSQVPTPPPTSLPAATLELQVSRSYGGRGAG